MGTAAMELLERIEPARVAAELDRFNCYHLVVLHWSEGVRNRLAGAAPFLLERTLEEVADASLVAARRIARRVAELGGTITADPSRIVDASLLGRFELPDDCSDVAAIVGYAVERVRTAIRGYGALLKDVRGRDALTERLVLELLAEEVAREDEMESVLAPKAGTR